MYEVSNGGEREDWAVRDGGIAPELPLVVIVNGGSASAAEVVAGALQAHGRARLFGSRTYGKGSVQTFRQMSDGSALYLTIARWYTPDGQVIQDRGISPDVSIPVVRGSTTDVSPDVPLIVAYTELLESVDSAGE
jgi:carboxyl-terminal processing protease